LNIFYISILGWLSKSEPKLSASILKQHIHDNRALDHESFD
jgi:hypothetical protein